MSQQFNITDEIIHLQENDVQYDTNVPDISSLSNYDVLSYFDDLLEILQSNSQILMDVSIYDKVKVFLAYFDDLELGLVHNLVDLLVNSFADQMTSISADIQENNQHNFEMDRNLLLRYSFILYWLIERSEIRWRGVKQQMEKDDAAATYASGKTNSSRNKKVNKKKRDNIWSWSSQRVNVLQAAVRAIKLNLHRLIFSDSERETVISLFSKSVSLMLEDPDTIKDDEAKDAVLMVICDIIDRFESKLTGKDSGLLNGIQGRILNDYLREEHLSDFCADILISLANDYENKQPVENVLMHSSDKVFTERDLKQAKAFSRFLVKLSEQVPRETLKQLVNLQAHIDSSSYTIRVAMMEVIGNIIHLHLATDTSDNAASKLYSLYDILEERFRDMSSYVRNKVLQVLGKLAEFRENSSVSDIPVARRLQLVKLCVGRLKDKTSIVRRSALKLLITFIKYSPFMMISHDEGNMSLKYFISRKESLELVITAKSGNNSNKVGVNNESGNEREEKELSNEKSNKLGAIMDEDSPFNETNIVNENSNVVNNEPNLATEDELRNLRTLLMYYDDGIKFISQIEGSIDSILELLGSNVKSEVIETMNFFVTAHEYGMDCAMVGLLKMAHKVWDKDTGENERLSVREHVLLCYGNVFFSNDLSEQELEAVSPIIANNIIKLTMSMSMAEQTSLEQIIGLIVKQKKFPAPVINQLWNIFVAKKGHSQNRQGAIKLLGMIGKVEKSVVAMDLDSLLKVGLGSLGRKDLTLAKYTCVALQQLGSMSREKGIVNQQSLKRFPATHPVFHRIVELMLEDTNSSQWFGFAEQGIDAIYSISEHPDSLTEVLLRKLFEKCFLEQEILELENLDLNDEDEDKKFKRKINLSTMDKCNSIQLSQLCFAIGHVAVKQIVHLEAVELEWKRRKFLDEDKKRKSVEKSGKKKVKEEEEEEADELDNVVGTAEDEVVDWIQNLRERELLYGENSILALLAPMIVYICTNNSTFSNSTLQIVATLSLCKLMCVSSDFCEAHLQLLFTILERTSSPVIRSNIIIGLGDMTVCFNSLIDQNISYLYRRLADPDDDVKKNTFMVLTFLILNGMVKVKGHLSEMAKCLVDEDRRISDLAKLFFNELATKDNAIYNNLPDIISNLSHSTNGVDESTFKEIMNFLLVLIKKDRQTESLVDKLCQRFKTAETERQWRDIGLCLASLQYDSDKTIKRILEHYSVYQHKLYEPVLRKYMLDVCQKSKKNAKATELKQQIDELEKRIVAAGGE